MISTNLLPNEPVPPVTITEASLQFTAGVSFLSLIARRPR
jgi:hypothetical protein